MEKGLIQLYYGNGKGKTTAAMGLIMRASGRGFKTFICQFMKCSESGEVCILRNLPGVTYRENTVESPFLFHMTEEQREHFRELYSSEFDLLAEKIRTGAYDLAVLDEVVDIYTLGLLPKEKLHALMEEKPFGTELVLTGHPNHEDLSELIERADYVTKFVKEKHPYDKGEQSRIGIEE